MAIRGFQRPQIGPRRTQNVHFEAISEFGGSELVEQFGTRLEQVRADLGRAIGTLPLVRNDHYGLKMDQNGHFCARSWSGDSELEWI